MVQVKLYRCAGFSVRCFVVVVDLALTAPMLLHVLFTNFCLPALWIGYGASYCGYHFTGSEVSCFFQGIWFSCIKGYFIKVLWMTKLFSVLFSCNSNWIGFQLFSTNLIGQKQFENSILNFHEIHWAGISGTIFFALISKISYFTHMTSIKQIWFL